MNKGNIFIYFSCLFHLLIWLFVAFGGFFSDKIIFFNMLIVLPVIYIAQAMPNHPITKEKVKYILEHRDEFSDPEPFVSYCYNKVDPKEVEHLKKEFGGKEDEIIKVIMIIQEYENCFGIPKLCTLIYRNFCNSYRNPMDAQGFIVLAYILNSIAFLSKHNKYVFKQIF
jgi:hypothetical protein